MTRPDIACLCVDHGVHCALTVTGDHREEFLELFRQEHCGPGHLPEDPPRSWYKQEAAFKRHLARVRADLARLGRTEDVEVVDTRRTDNVDSGGRL